MKRAAAKPDSHPRRSVAVGRLGRTGKWVAGIAAGVVSAVLVGTLTGLLTSAGHHALSPPETGPLVAVSRAGPSVDPAVIVTPTPLQGVSYPRSVSARARWARKHHVADPGFTVLDVTVTGRAGRAIVLEDMTVQVTRRPARAWSLAIVRPGSGSSLEGRCVMVDLDKPSTRAKLVQCGPESHTPARFPFKVTPTDVEAFQIAASTERCDCTWTATLHWADGVRTGTTEIADHGNPFHTVGIKRLHAFQLVGDRFQPRRR